MVFVKLVKNKAYSMRMQVKPKRRRQSKTDYFARRRLVCQDKNKFDSRKYRLVARRTNTKIITQIIYSTMTGDRVMCAADSTELINHNITAYATGLLLARRLLKQVGLADMYKANSDLNGEYFNVVEDIQDKRPFKALLDVGINSTTTGARVFAVMKGACDGGLNVPHNTKRFAGYNNSKTEVVKNKRGKAESSEKTVASFDATILRARIFGNHVTQYMNTMKKEDPEKFKRHFSKWEKCLTTAKAKTCEDLYKKAHAAIIANPDRKKKAGNAKPTRKVVTPGGSRVYADSKGRKWLRHFRLTNQERQVRVAKKFQDFAAGAQ